MLHRTSMYRYTPDFLHVAIYIYIYIYKPFITLFASHAHPKHPSPKETLMKTFGKATSSCDIM